jgi:hypothetical protein
VTPQREREREMVAVRVDGRRLVAHSEVQCELPGEQDLDHGPAAAA